MPITLALVALLAFYVAFNLGANDVANAMGTSVGSKAVTLKQALIIAGVLEFAGAVLFGHEVTETLATKVANPALFAATPQILVMGMVTVLLASGVWLQIATSRGLPVSSSHAVVGAIAGFSWVALGVGAIDWSSIGSITVGWILTPIISGAIAALFYSQIKRWILDQPNQLVQLNEWLPWLSALLIGTFGVIVLPSLTQPLSNFLINQIGLNLPAYDIPIFTGAVAAVGLTFYSWNQLGHKSPVPSPQSPVPNPQSPIPNPQSPILNPQSPIPNPTERLFARFQLLSACFVAFAHGSNDVGNAIAPLAAIVYINQTGSVPINGITTPLWILILGGIGIVGGLAIWGKKVIATIGENIISLQPSSGFCAELATATTILLASRLGLPVSTSHALVGGVVGIGLVQNIKSIQFQTLKGIAAAWLITVPASAILSAAIFSLVRMIFL
ncbi:MULTISPECIES: inorganic phosphate transporter [unclassified Tolypothrix]|uniref:inorganic phosphate transporter n=3 Tax=Tolypothrix TaxID=111782 RepID=UPI0005EAA3A4|nr:MULTISPECIES: inorganic phosphate transporter [unclassified Tolypothrix]EKF05270.1 phosphate transporter family protein [Tolypothrix sp. PCC 7601]UYD25646.1 inorganic phosphate transporter [Tolypothrix sp. PCC 7712]UYD32113.1 inorganic phosphate transporter [Tolypothrix sp. PCC 7601]BAY91624.1 phosphate transporter [Microchaete diplosiphon NIES-3275]